MSHFNPRKYRNHCKRVQAHIALHECRDIASRELGPQNRSDLASDELLLMAEHKLRAK